MNAYYDIIIIGGGPAGLCCACLLANKGISVAIIEKQQETALSRPIPDGRDIALTYNSHYVLTQAGIWGHIPDEAISFIKEAVVLNGKSSYFLHFGAANTVEGKLAHLVPNHHIREAAYRVAQQAGIVFVTGQSVVSLSSNANDATIRLSNGDTLRSSLIIAADGRFSEIRRKGGIAASMHDFGRTAIVCHMEHEKPHGYRASEYFHYGHTLATLPLHQQHSSIVLTVKTSFADTVLSASEQDFSTMIEEYLGYRLGGMRLVGQRYSYPLVSVYAKQFCSQRLVLIGDAAVGMHPVTAHGFNFSIKGVQLLCENIGRNTDRGAPAGLQRYQEQHRRATLPLYLATNAIVRLYTDDSTPAKCARHILLRLANQISPVKRAITHKLTALLPAN